MTFPLIAVSFPPLLKDVILVVASAIGAAIATAAAFQRYINARVVQALKTKEAEQQLDLILQGPALAERMVAVFNSADGRKRFGEIIAMPEVWTPLATATLTTQLSSAYLERSDVKKTLADVLKNDPCRDAIGEALRGETAIQNIAAALYVAAVQEALLAVLAGAARPTIAAIAATVDINDRVLAALRANPAALFQIIESDLARLLILLERNDVRERVLRWLESDEGRKYFESLFDRRTTREALADALLLHAPTLRRLHDMLEDPFIKSDARQP